MKMTEAQKAAMLRRDEAVALYGGENCGSAFITYGRRWNKKVYLARIYGKIYEFCESGTIFTSAKRTKLPEFRHPTHCKCGGKLLASFSMCRHREITEKGKLGPWTDGGEIDLDGYECEECGELLDA